MSDVRKSLPQLLVIVGPTASGKSALAVSLARLFNGEVVSADSRQVYKGFDIGSGKVTKREMRGVPHHLLDVASPKRTFTVAQYQKLALRATLDILERGKLPILCGGTGFYIQAIVDGILLPAVKPDQKLRTRLETLSTDALFRILKKKDFERALNIDSANRRRLIRALEITVSLGRVPPLARVPNSFTVLMLGLKWDQASLKKRIRIRLLKRLRIGLIAEVRRLHENEGLSFKRLERFGLEYRTVARFLQGETTRNQMVAELDRAIFQYSKRQMTWFKRDKRITWIRSFHEAHAFVLDFLARPSSQSVKH